MSNVTEILPPDCCALFEPQLASLSTTADIGAFLKKCHQEINSLDRLSSGAGVALLAHNCALVDAVLRRLFALAVEHAAALAPAGEDAPTMPELTIVASGGYGRRELAPYSDVDVTFVSVREDDAYLNAIIKDMFQSVMDVFLYGANLKVGYAYRLLGDLGQLDHQTQTTLLDARFLCGDSELFKEFRATFRAQLLTADFMFQKWAERKSVLAKFGGDQVYVVEPQIKEGAGGLRDIQNAEWIGEARYRVSYSRVWRTLVEQGIVTERESASIRAAREFLWNVRSVLHMVAGEARDTMTTEKQESVAAYLGYPDGPETPAVETFMREYYTHAAEARRIARKAIKRCLDSEILLGLGLASIRRSLYVADPDIADRDMAMPLHAAELAQAYSLTISDELEEAICRFLERHPTAPDPAYAGRVFTRLLASKDASAILDRLSEQGVLAWLLPEFAPLMTLIPYDAAHDFTVGAHSLRVVRNLHQFHQETDPRFADFRRVAGEVAFPEVLNLAGLIHDIGKQWPEGGHAETGADASVLIAERIGWDTERRDKLVFLIRNHLLMAETSRLRDLSLEETVREFTRQVPDMESLNMLYLLTCADTQAVGEGVWTEVKGKFLTELYYRAEAVLAGGSSGETPAFVPNLARQRDRIRKQLAQHNLPIDLIHEHTRNLPAQYLLNTPLEEMYLHIAMIGRLRETFTPIVDFRHEFGNDYTEITICAYDDPKPGLLAKITGVLYAHDINVHVAQVFTREASVRIAIDTLWIDYRGKPLASGKKAEIQESLRKVMLGEMALADLLKKRNKPVKDQTIYSAKIDDTTSDQFSLLEVSAPDEKGVVYRLANVVSGLGWNIHAARLSVWGSRARDAFYVTGPDGKKLPASDVARLLEVLPVSTFVKRKLTTAGGG
ncbi:bifunctional uridylyltransferase/uridylyl-removing enzyme [Capsulimonas corticalis]|uniref:Bifunctional uridylyltransferase/uridylyl-removing enzyme n=1 Tax=Capsulimonas corticalis TaxID=2219043 RepID=A0A402CXX7_9BACT|nr:HD domain-containing protein [Capsulimonas corticalis]BDI32137.1 bifunctional uridylyltransferase/uridylyl-removing enzyme [Capsulimonas corticalis]